MKCLGVYILLETVDAIYTIIQMCRNGIVAASLSFILQKEMATRISRGKQQVYIHSMAVQKARMTIILPRLYLLVHLLTHSTYTPPLVTEPSAPRDLMLVERTNVSLFITWSSPESNGGSTIIDYRVRTENQRTFEIVTQMGLGVVNEYNITDLDPLTTYNVFVAAINSIGRGDEISIEAATLSNSK